VKRTQQIRGPYKIFGKTMMTKTLPVTDEEVFDDTDFYQHLLKEVVESKIDLHSDSITQARQWLAAQQLQQKSRKSYTKKATKGRQLRYIVHEKLVNFMVPTSRLIWHEERINELFSFLLGRKT
jgi:protein AATF/BFR2